MQTGKVMKKVCFGLVLLFSNLAIAAADSVAVFHRPEKVVVLINENGAQSRLQQFMDALSADHRVFWVTRDESIKIDCARNTEKVACNFRFTPSRAVNIQDKSVFAETTAEELNKSTFQMAFESSREDRFLLTMTPEGIQFWAGKRGQQSPLD